MPKFTAVLSRTYETRLDIEAENEKQAKTIMDSMLASGTAYTIELEQCNVVSEECTIYPKLLTASVLRAYLNEFERRGNDLSKATINCRHDDDDDVYVVREVEEDLFDEQTNNILTSIILKTE
jgi:hypothetical protein